ncbi:MAG: hypothetical protein ACFB10_12680 [Salibacteraceae bacterium]
MKNLFLILALVCVTAVSSFAQQAGTYHFGDKDAPDLVLAPSHPGYSAFVRAVNNNSQLNTGNVNWQGLASEIKATPSLKPYADWLGSPAAAAGVWMYCCSANGWSCYAHVPYSCEYACNCSQAKEADKSR